jgi:hypothetical protein
MPLARQTHRRAVRSRRRAFALFALALALFATLPCAAIAGEQSCCAASTKCSDALEAPCAQLAATPCCGESGVPADAPYAPQLPDLRNVGLYIEVQDAHVEILCVARTRRGLPDALRSHTTIREVVLRL